MGAELLEGLGDGQALGLPADPLAAGVVADQRTELGGGLAEQAVEGGEADRLVDSLDLDRPLAVLAALVAGRGDPGLRACFSVKDGRTSISDEIASRLLNQRCTASQSSGRNGLILTSTSEPRSLVIGRDDTSGIPVIPGPAPGR